MKRYDTRGCDQACPAEMREDPEGGWVRFDAVEALQKQISRANRARGQASEAPKGMREVSPGIYVEEQSTSIFAKASPSQDTPATATPREASPLPRYDLEDTGSGPEAFMQMVARPQGEWVEFDTVNALLAERDSLLEKDRHLQIDHDTFQYLAAQRKGDLGDVTRERDDARASATMWEREARRLGLEMGAEVEKLTHQRNGAERAGDEARAEVERLKAENSKLELDAQSEGLHVEHYDAMVKRVAELKAEVDTARTESMGVIDDLETQCEGRQRRIEILAAKGNRDLERIAGLRAALEEIAARGDGWRDSAGFCRTDCRIHAHGAVTCAREALAKLGGEP